MIEVEGLTKRYEGGLVAVRDLSFRVEAGDCFGFIGPNGAGKTTTIRILATLLEPTSGRVRVDGHDVLERPEEVRQVMGFMPDYYGVYPGVRVWEYLDFFAASFRVPRRRRRAVVADVMALTDLTALADRDVSALSKGMKQRLCLAKTLVNDPRVLVLDEPAAGLDPRARIEIRALIRELRAMGKTILISSHILTELSDICNRVGIIERGELRATGGVDEIAARMRPVRTLLLRFVRGSSQAEALLRAHPQVRGLRPEGEERLHLAYEGAPEDLHRVVKAVVDAGLPLVGLEAEKYDLEDIFMDVTRGDLA